MMDQAMISEIRGAVVEVLAATFSQAAHIEALARKPALRPGEVAELFGISVRTLENWRRLGKGPRFVRHDRFVIYLRREIDAYLQNHSVRTVDAR